MALLAALDRFNTAHPWSHNDLFAGFVLRNARAVKRAGGTCAVDVGCGTGRLVGRLALVLPEVFGIESDPDAAAVATARFSRSAGVRIEQRPFGHEPPDRYDMVVFVASLHHMRLAATLEDARRSLREGGRIVIVGLARETAADTPRSLISLALNPIVGLVLHPSRAEQPSSGVEAPTATAAESFEEIRGVARRILPGVRMRRRLLWRYTATWTAPIGNVGWRE